jgi:hypothetical protein
MSLARERAAIGLRPASTEATTWVRRGEGDGPTSAYTARLTIDVTPLLRGRIKVIAFERGITVAAMLRELLEREFQKELR